MLILFFLVAETKTKPSHVTIHASSRETAQWAFSPCERRTVLDLTVGLSHRDTLAMLC